MKKVAVLGAGTMGLGIAQTCLKAGLEVMVVDIFGKNPGMMEKTQKKLWLEMFLEKIDKDHLLYASSAEVDKAFARVTWVDNAEENEEALGVLCGCDAVVEAVFENIDLKEKLFRIIEAYVDDNTPIYSNTSTISIGRLAQAMRYPARFMGMHFFNPVPRMNLIEMIPHSGTNQETIAKANEFADLLKKKHYLAPDIPGFVVNRIAVPMIIYFYQELENGASLAEIDKAFVTGTWVTHEPSRRIVEAMIRDAKGIIERDQLNAPVQVTPLEIDALMTLGTTFRSGPFKLAEALTNLDSGRTTDAELKFKMGPGQFTDLVGLDVGMDCIKSFSRQEPGNSRWQVPMALEEMVSQGKLGQKTGKGFYEHGARVDMERTPDNYVKIVFGDGEANVLSTELVKELTKTFRSLQDDDAKAIFLEGRGKVFAAGANIKEFPLGFKDEANTKEILEAFLGLTGSIAVCKAPVVAVVRKMALGGGYELALACDYIIAEEGSEVGLPEVNLGLLPGAGGTQRLPRRVGLAKGLEAILSGKPIKAVTPWVDTVVTPGTPFEYLKYFGDHATKNTKQLGSPNYSSVDLVALGEVARDLLLKRKQEQGRAPLSFLLILEAIDMGIDEPLSQGLLLEILMFQTVIKSRDAEEGIRAFMEKRKPNFEGK